MNTALAVCHPCGWAEDAATRAWHEQLAERLASLTPPSRKNEFWRYSRLGDILHAHGVLQIAVMAIGVATLFG